MATANVRIRSMRGVTVKCELTMVVELTWWLRVRIKISKALIHLAFWLIGAEVVWEDGK